MEIVRLLKQDHRTVKRLFRQFEQSSRSRDKQRIGEEVIDELSRHAAVEEQLVYPLLRERDRRAEDAVLEALEEHHVAKATLAELDKMSADDERYAAKMTVLSEAIKHHINEEESTFLPRLERVTSGAERKELGKAVADMKETAPNHPHPMAPDTPPGNIISGVLATVMDFGKDTARTLMSPVKAQARRGIARRGGPSKATRRSRRGATAARRATAPKTKRRSRKRATAARRATAPKTKRRSRKRASAARRFKKR